MAKKTTPFDTIVDAAFGSVALLAWIFVWWWFEAGLVAALGGSLVVGCLLLILLIGAVVPVAYKREFAAWVAESPVDGDHAQATAAIRKLGEQLQSLRQLRRELVGRKVTGMLPIHLEEHERTLAALREAIEVIPSHERVWRERLVVLSAQRVLQCTLRSVPPWLGGAPFKDYPQGSEKLRPKKSVNMRGAIAEATDALRKVTAAQASMKQIEERMIKELPDASKEMRKHLQTLLERVEGLRKQLLSRVAECQMREDRRRTVELLAQTPAGKLRAGKLDMFFPKNIEPIDTGLLMSVPTNIDLEDNLRELKRMVAHNAAAGAADHEIEATTQAPGGRVLPPRRPKKTS